MKKEELKNYLESYNLTYDLEEDYINIYNYCIDYMNDTQDFDIEYLFNDFVTYDTAEEIAKSEIDNGGLIRLYYFLGNANLNNNLFRIDGYGNLEDVCSDDIRNLIDEILETLKD